MTQSWTIRRATVADLDQLVALRLRLEQESGHLEPGQPTAEMGVATAAYFQQTLLNGLLLVWVAEIGPEIIGTSGLTFFQKPPSLTNTSGQEAYIFNMYTPPRWRGQGIASALLQTLLRYIRHTEAHRVWMYATGAGQPLYEATGFRQKRRSTTELELLW